MRCLAADPTDGEVAYAGTHGTGLFRTVDRGFTWRQLGPADAIVTSVAPSAHEPGLVWVGLKPARVAASRNGGWQLCQPFPRWRSWFWLTPAERPFSQPYVQGLAESPADRNVLLAGIEAGALVRSDDGGRSWSGHLRSASRDCHTLAFHPRDGAWAYEGGGTGPALSRDGGHTWTKEVGGLDRRYCWAVAADPERPDTWYVAGSPGPRQAHGGANAEAKIFRWTEDRWRALGGGLPNPLRSMPYGLACPVPGHVYAALANGDVWHSGDHGDTWTRLPMSLEHVARAFVVLPDS